MVCWLFCLCVNVVYFKQIDAELIHIHELIHILELMHIQELTHIHLGHITYFTCLLLP